VDFNISTIYQRDKHCMFYQWAALAGLTKEFQSILGFMKFSIGVFAVDDPQIPLDQEKIPSERANSHALNVLYPPQIVTQPYQLRIKVFKGEKLKKMDTFGQTDPFVTVEYGVARAETRVIKVTLDPVWNEELFIPVSFPTINNRVIVKLFDWEQAQTNELMGSNIFKIEDIKAKKYKDPFWVNIYGARAEAKVAYYKSMMNNIPETATMWKGRVQLSMYLEECANPILGTFPIKDAKSVDNASKVKREKYDLRADIHYAMNLPKNDEKYSIRIRWGKIELSSKKINSKNRMIEIYETLTGSDEFPFGSSEGLEIPDVFIYINDGNKDFSYVRKAYDFFTDVAAKPRCIFFQNDKACTEKRDDLAGIVKMRLYVCKASENPQQLALYGWNRNVEKRPSQTEWRIHLNVYQAKDLMPGDASGLSDPFMESYFYGTEGKTTVIKDTVNPIWNERLEFAARFDSAEDAPPFMLTLWDEDSMSNDFLGSSILTIEKSDLNPQMTPPPKWVTIRYGKGGQESGQILLSVCCYSRNELIPRSPYIEPERQKYFINMKILGLRSLESIGVLPVKRAFVRFDIDSLKKNTERSFLPEKKALVTEPLEPGSNPNIMTVINVEVMLPINPDFCPSMQCVVYDYLIKGLSQPRIGNFAIPLGECIKKTKQELNKRIETMTTFYHTHLEELRSKKVQERIASVAGIKVKEIEIVVDKQVLKDHIQDEQEVEALLNSEDPVEKAKASQAFIIVSTLDPEGNELEKPDPKKYLALGYNKKDKTSQKHYRYYIDKELEKSDLIDESPFDTIPIYRGKKASDESFFSKYFTLVEEYRQVGQFKAMINVMSEQDNIIFNAKLAAVGQFANTSGLEFSDREFLKKTDVIVRLYVIEAEGLPDKDENSHSDPYLVIKFGKKVINESKEYQRDCPNPKFHKYYEFSTQLPGASNLSIQLWDHDDLDPDDLIGRTDIDIEDRWFSRRWRSLKHVPIETRKLYVPSSHIAQGSVKLWVEIIPKEERNAPIWQIIPKPTMEFELRVVVWECKNVPRVDIEDASDIYVTAALEDGPELRTDTHFRSTNGKGSFNWRLVFKTTLPQEKNRISFKLWDKDLLSKNDYISEASFDFDKFAQKAFEQEETVLIKPEKDPKFWITCSNTVAKNGVNETIPMGEILISMSLVPKKQAELSPVGQGRNTPNQNPYLPPPVGRFQWTWNPIKLFEQLVGPVARNTVLIVIGIICLAFIIVMTLPPLIANFITG